MNIYTCYTSSHGLKCGCLCEVINDTSVTYAADGEIRHIMFKDGKFNEESYQVKGSILSIAAILAKHNTLIIAALLLSHNYSLELKGSGVPTKSYNVAYMPSTLVIVCIT